MHQEYNELILTLDDRDRQVVERYAETKRKGDSYKEFYPDATENDIRKFYARNKIKSAIRLCKESILQESQKQLQSQAIDKALVQSMLLKLSQFNIIKFLVMKDGRPHYDFSTATDDDWYCIGEYTANRVIRGGDEDIYPVEAIKLKSVDKIKAIELLGKTVGAFTDRVEMDSNVTVVFDDSFEYEDDDGE